MVINYIFYKNILAVVPAFYFGFYSVMSGRLLFNVWMQQTFNLVTFVPIVVYGKLVKHRECTCYSHTFIDILLFRKLSHWHSLLIFSIYILNTEYNTEYATLLGRLVLGVLDRDVEDATALQFPQLYQETKKGVFFSVPISGWWLLLSVVHSLLSFFLPYIAYENQVRAVEPTLLQLKDWRNYC